MTSNSTLKMCGSKWVFRLPLSNAACSDSSDDAKKTTGNGDTAGDGDKVGDGDGDMMGDGDMGGDGGEVGDGDGDTPGDGDMTGDGDGDATGDGDMTGDGDGGLETGAENPCGSQDPTATEPVEIDFGSEGKFTFDGSMAGGQLAGIHTCRWESADGTLLTFSASSPDPFNPTAVGTELTVSELKWERNTEDLGGQSDQFNTATAKVRVIKGGPFSALNAFDPFTVCIYDVEDFTHPNIADTEATWPGPVAMACN